MVACPPSLAITTELGDPGTKQATPRPVPGPSTAIGSAASGLAASQRIEIGRRQLRQ